MERNDLKEAVANLRTWTSSEVYTTKADEWKETVDDIINLFKHRLTIENRNVVYITDVREKVVSRRVAEHCAYIGGKYIGKIYLDKKGNIFGNIADVKKEYGEDVVFCTPASENEYSATAYVAECTYVPEIDCVLFGIKSFSNYCHVANINDDNEHLHHLTESDARYIIMDKDMMCIEGSRMPSNVAYLYFGGEIKIDGMMEAIRQLLNLDVGIVNVGGNRYIPLDCIGNLVEFSKYKAKLAYKSGKVQKKIDELVAMKEFDSTPMRNRMPHEYENLVCQTNINKIDTNTSVIRWSYSYRDTGFDGMRVYIEGNDVYACKRNNQGQFIKVALSTLNQKNFTSEYAAEAVADDMTGTRLEWYASVINSIPEKHRMTLLITFLNDVRVEQLVKLGLCDSICNLLENNSNNIGDSIRQTLHVNRAEENNKNIYRWMGVSKYQLNEIVKMCNDSKKRHANEHVIYVIGHLKAMFACDDISHFDKKLFDDMLAVYSTYFKDHYDYESWYSVTPASIRGLINKAINADDTGVFANNMRRYVPTIMKICEWRREAFNTYSDFIEMVCKMNIRQQVKLYPATRDELNEMHDNVAAIFNLNKSTYQRNAFITRMADLKKMEYENDDFEFCVKAPEVPEDLAVEGLELHHCVKSYIDRVCDGKTNILFIRKKSDVSKPFFTVELTNDRVIAQVHGFSNRNANTEPNMEEFVQRWARNKRLKIGAFNRVRG